MMANLFGVYLHGAAGSLVEDNVITGRDDLRTAEAGNGVSIWNAPGAQVIGNTISQGRDGIFVNVSKDNVFAHNTFTDLRFAIHYMYTNTSKVIGNRSKGNHVGWAIMFPTGWRSATTSRSTTVTTACCSTPPTGRKSPATPCAAAGRNACSCTTPTRTFWPTIGSNPAPSASISPPVRKATWSPATASSPTAPR
jgi:parallel beta-helix repeat protein